MAVALPRTTREYAAAEARWTCWQVKGSTINAVSENRTCANCTAQGRPSVNCFCALRAPSHSGTYVYLITGQVRRTLRRQCAEVPWPPGVGRNTGSHCSGEATHHLAWLRQPRREQQRRRHRRRERQAARELVSDAGDKKVVVHEEVCEHEPRGRRGDGVVADGGGERAVEWREEVHAHEEEAALAQRAQHVAAELLACESPGRWANGVADVKAAQLAALQQRHAPESAQRSVWPAHTAARTVRRMAGVLAVLCSSMWKTCTVATTMLTCKLTACASRATCQYERGRTSAFSTCMQLRRLRSSSAWSMWHGPGTLHGRSSRRVRQRAACRCRGATRWLRRKEQW